jgi:hypothetical protein
MPSNEELSNLGAPGVFSPSEVREMIGQVHCERCERAVEQTDILAENSRPYMVALTVRCHGQYSRRAILNAELSHYRSLGSRFILDLEGRIRTVITGDHATITRSAAAIAPNGLDAVVSVVGIGAGVPEEARAVLRDIHCNTCGRQVDRTSISRRDSQSVSVTVDCHGFTARREIPDVVLGARVSAGNRIRLDSNNTLYWSSVGRDLPEPHLGHPADQPITGGSQADPSPETPGEASSVPAYHVACSACNRPVQSYGVTRYAANRTVTFDVRCHGARERFTVYSPALDWSTVILVAFTRPGDAVNRSALHGRLVAAVPRFSGTDDVFFPHVMESSTNHSWETPRFWQEHNRSPANPCREINSPPFFPWMLRTDADAVSMADAVASAAASVESLLSRERRPGRPRISALPAYKLKAHEYADVHPGIARLDAAERRAKSGPR